MKLYFRRISILLFLSFFICLSNTYAARFMPLSLTQVKQQAVDTFVGTVVSVSNRVGDQGKMYWTDYTVSINESLDGKQAEKERVISFAGGTVGGQSLGVVGVPRPMASNTVAPLLHRLTNHNIRR